jgi:two-component system, OmpR family, sensor histidine kinase CpxA
MRSLFLKIFFWFWLTAILTGIALVLSFVLQPGSIPARWHAALTETAGVYGRAAAGEFERRGAAAASGYIDELFTNARTSACLYEADGLEIAGRACTSFTSLARRASSSGKSVFDMRYGIVRIALPVRTTTGRTFVFATELPAGPRAAFGPSRGGLALHWAVAFLVSGLICYLLARHLTDPILRLRQASHKLAAGDLNARAASSTGERRDELGDLVRDFNAMAERIQMLVSGQCQLISDVSHELRSPLARLTVALDLARERKGDDSAFDRMDKDFDRLNEMLERLLAVARLDAIGPSFATEVVDFKAVVAEVVDDAQFEVRDRNRIVRFIGTDVQVNANPTLLRSAVENIIRNAARYTAAGTCVEVELRTEERGDTKMAVLAVRDHGPGVPESELNNIFRAFYRVGDARDRESGGIGLGLAIADRVIRAHRGIIRATNAAGGGLEVQATIPALSA